MSNEILLPGRPCYCGRNDCVEAWLSGPAFEARYLERSQQHRSASDITSRLQTDQLAADLMEQYCHLLALALSNVINIFDPDIIVLGGGMSNIPQLFMIVCQRSYQPMFFLIRSTPPSGRHTMETLAV